MSIVWFDDETKQSNDLPWIKEYIAEGGSGDIPTDVWSVYVCPTGLLVITEFWKGFVYSRAKTHSQLSEALNAYIDYRELLPRLVCCASDTGRLSFGLNKGFVDAAWTKHNREYSQMFRSDGEFPTDTKTRLPNNPLLPPSPRSSAGASTNGVDPKSKRAKSPA